MPVCCCVWLCRLIYEYVVLCMGMWAFVWLCSVVYGYVGLCMLCGLVYVCV